MSSYEEFKFHIKNLGLLPYTSKKEVKAKYLKLSKIHHPDAGGDAKRFQEIGNSYEIVKKYMENYRFNFSEDEFFRQNPDIKMKEQFYKGR